MMNNNKILTVSYGTFSCTLEGFDDSFGTMKAIAEYFRDLASDDRYFGAEPPQPDAEMLARIAQKEISRRVEAREHEGRIVLSAQEDPKVEPAPIAAPIAAAATVAAASEVTARASEPVADASATPSEDVSEDTDDLIAGAVAQEDTAHAEPAAEDETEAETVEVEALPEAPTEAVVEDVVSQDETDTVDDEPSIEEGGLEVETAAEAADEEITAASDDDAAEVFIADAAEEDTAEAFFANSVTTDVDDANADEEALTADLMTSDADMPVAEDVPAPKATIPDSIADKLQRIRAVVSKGDTAPIEDAQYDEEDGTPAQTPDAFVSDFMSVETTDEAPEDTAADAVAEAAADIEQAFEADDALTNDEAFEAEEASFDADLASALDRFDAVANDRAGIAETTTDESDEVIDLTGYEVSKADLPVEGEDDDDMTLMDADDDEVEDVLDNLFGQAAIEEANEDDTEALVASMDLDEGDEDVAPTARLMKVKSADLEAALEQDESQELVDEATKTDHEDAEQTDQAHAARDTLPKLEDGQDADVSRLMAEADSQMQEPESAGRRKAFAHLRAAVAAKKADRAMGQDDAAETGDQAYRSDLAEAVKPRRPVVNATARTERPNTDAETAPLKLVAEQRVDTARRDGPVMPRRVAAADTSLIADASGDSFAAFADEVGATKLPELLEAAAAYMSFVEGHDQFSRPQLMTKIRQVEAEDYSREDSLRSFGQLLRAGKIQKIKGGRFTVSEDIGFKPDERAAS